MTSLSEVYQGGRERDVNLRRLYLGVGLFLVGSGLVVAGIVVAATDLFLDSMTLTEVRRLGAVLGGVGVPAVFLGIFAVLPASRRTRAAAVIGATVAFLGVGLFWHAYPCQWSGSNCGAGLPNLTLPTISIYFFGTITTFWCLFVGVANFKTRNDPGGTVTMEITQGGETRIVEVERSAISGHGGVGVFGEMPDGEVETQTNHPTADGGAAANDIRSPTDRTDGDAEAFTDTAPSVGDPYCGNCAHFDYVRTDDGLDPYCGVRDERMDDMEPCSEWTPRSSDR